MNERRFCDATGSDGFLCPARGVYEVSNKFYCGTHVTEARGEKANAIARLAKVKS